MQQKLMKKTAIFCIIFFLVSMGAICYLSSVKVIVIDDVAQDEVKEAAVVKEAAQESGTDRKLKFQLGEADTSYLRIPIPAGSRAAEITVENHYMNKEIRIFVPRAEEEFYVENSVSGNRESVIEGTFDAAEEGIVLNFRLTGIYECRTILENENLYISFLAPKEMYDKIVVIDPAYGGVDSGSNVDGLKGKDITLQIARKLKEKLDDSDIKAYYTRMDDTNPAREDRIGFANEVKTDMFIRIEVNSSADASVYGTETIYNGDYFIPGFGNIELSDCLEREVVTAIKGKALGLIKAENEDYELLEATIPAATVRVGYLTNAQEAILLGREEYADKIAEGIYNAIIKAYEENVR